MKACWILACRGSRQPKMGDFAGKNYALVTGVAMGIGRAIAEELAAAGAVLALADVNEAKLAETVGEFRA